MAAAYDVATACSGFPYGLSLAAGHIAAGQAKNVLVITEQDRVVLKGSVKSPSEAERVKGVGVGSTIRR